jgi:fructose-1,6-bisphosphatase I
MDRQTTNLQHFLLNRQKDYPEATGEFTSLFQDILLASKIISREVNKAGLVEILGLTGKVNVQGEEVQKLDEFSLETFVKVMRRGGSLCVMASEETDDIISIPDKYPKGKYVLVFDPLDGSSNIDANVSIGTIFGIYKRVTDENKDEKCGYADVLQPAKDLVAAGYVIYGSSTMFVYSTGQGVHGFTLDPSVGEFLLSHEDIKIPKKSKIYSANEGNYNKWSDGVKRYIDYLKTEGKETERPYKSRYIGSLVADFHRNLLYGGIFMYPRDKKSKNGKLRLLYEAGPLAYIVKQAGGYASDGKTDILEIVPDEIHQRVPLFIGSEEDVKKLEEFIKKHGDDVC